MSSGGCDIFVMILVFRLWFVSSTVSWNREYEIININVSCACTLKDFECELAELDREGFKSGVRVVVGWWQQLWLAGGCIDRVGTELEVETVVIEWRVRTGW